MRIFIILLIILSMLPLQAFAQPVPTIPPGEDVITSVKKGDPAPYSGQIFDMNTSIRWANWLVMYKERLKLDVEAQQKICKAETELRDKKLAFEEEKYKRVVTDLETKLKAAEDPPFYRTFAFGFGVGVVGTLAVVVATGYVMHAVAKQ